MPVQRALVNDEITNYLVSFLETNVDVLRINWKDYNPGDDQKGKLYKVFKDLQNQLDYTPAIEIISKGRTTNIFSIGTQEDQYEYDIIISLTQAHKTESIVWLRIMANLIQELFNAFENRSFQVPHQNFCVYYSEATSIEYGFRRGFGLLAARIPWSCKLLKPNRGF